MDFGNFDDSTNVLFPGIVAAPLAPFYEKQVGPALDLDLKQKFAVFEPQEPLSAPQLLQEPKTKRRRFAERAFATAKNPPTTPPFRRGLSLLRKGRDREAFLAFEEGSKEKDPACNFMLSEMLFLDKGHKYKVDTKTRLERAADFLVKAYAAGLGIAAATLGARLYYGNGVDEDKEAGLEILSRAAEQNVPLACGMLSRIQLETGCKDLEQPVKLAQQAMGDNSVFGIRRMADALLVRNAPGDAFSRIMALRKATKLGDAYAALEYVEAVASSQSMSPMDVHALFAVAEKVSTFAPARANRVMGLLAFRSDQLGDPKKFLTEADELGDPEAPAILAAQKTLATDEFETAVFGMYFRAATRGSIQGKLSLAFCYRDGIGTKQSDFMAVYLLQELERIAVNRDDLLAFARRPVQDNLALSRAMATLADMLQLGMGMVTDLDRALQLVTRSAEILQNVMHRECVRQGTLSTLC